MEKRVKHQQTLAEGGFKKRREKTLKKQYLEEMEQTIVATAANVHDSQVMEYRWVVP